MKPINQNSRPNSSPATSSAIAAPPAAPLPPPPPPPNHPLRSSCESSTSSSSSATSQSFTQWRFSLPTTPTTTTTPTPPQPLQPPPTSSNLQELFHLSDLHLTTGSDTDRAAALHLLERSLVPNPPQDQPPCPPTLLRHVISHLTATSSSTTKILFALCLSPSNRRLAVEAGAVAAVVEAAPDLDGPPAERALAALELMCTVPEGAAEVRAHALAVPVMVTMMGRTGARGKEYAIGVLAVVYSGAAAEEMERESAAPPEEVARAVELALQGECSARGRRKGTQLLKRLQELSSSSSSYEALDSSHHTHEQPN